MFLMWSSRMMDTEQGSVCLPNLICTCCFSMSSLWMVNYVYRHFDKDKKFPAMLNLGALSQLKCACDKPHRSSRLMVIMDRAVLWRKLGFHMMLHDFDLKGIDFDLKGEILSGSLLLAAQLPSMSYNVLTKGHVLMKQLYLIVSNQCIYSNCIWQHQNKMSISKTYAL